MGSSPTKVQKGMDEQSQRVALVREHRAHVAESAGSLQKLSILLTTSDKNHNYEEEMEQLLTKHLTATTKLLNSFRNFRKLKDNKKVNDDFLEKMDQFSS